MTENTINTGYFFPERSLIVVVKYNFNQWDAPLEKKIRVLGEAIVWAKEEGMTELAHAYEDMLREHERQEN
jgi:hypothetical protein